MDIALQAQTSRNPKPCLESATKACCFEGSPEIKIISTYRNVGYAIFGYALILDS